MNYHLRLSGEPPLPPKDADFSFKIDFKKGSGNPRRVFDAASALIDAFEYIDSSLVQSVDTKIKPLLVLEDIEGGSIKIWLKNILSRVEDDALKQLEWKPLIGKYLVRAKYAIIEFCDAKEGAPQLENLRNALQRMAEETDIRQIPAYAPPDEKRLFNAIKKIQGAKSELNDGDRLTIETESKSYEVDLRSTWELQAPVDVSAARQSFGNGELTLLIRKPDFIKDTMWQFAHGKNTISVAIKDEKWLDDFHNRRIVISPGDALRCRMEFTYFYDEHGALIDQKMDILEVLQVIPGDPGQLNLL